MIKRYEVFASSRGSAYTGGDAEYYFGAVRGEGEYIHPLNGGHWVGGSFIVNGRHKAEVVMRKLMSAWGGPSYAFREWRDDRVEPAQPAPGGG